MRDLNSLFLISGYVHILLGIMHIPFIWSMLFKDWKREMDSVSVLHSKLINTLLLVITFFLIIVGCLLIIYREVMAMNGLNLLWLWIFISLFWWWRVFWQIISFYKINMQKSKIYLKILTILMIGSFIFNAYVFSKPIIRILG